MLSLQKAETYYYLEKKALKAFRLLVKNQQQSMKTEEHSKSRVGLEFICNFSKLSLVLRICRRCTIYTLGSVISSGNSAILDLNCFSENKRQSECLEIQHNCTFQSFHMQSYFTLTCHILADKRSQQNLFHSLKLGAPFFFYFPSGTLIYDLVQESTKKSSNDTYGFGYQPLLNSR